LGLRVQGSEFEDQGLKVGVLVWVNLQEEFGRPSCLSNPGMSATSARVLCFVFCVLCLVFGVECLVSGVCFRV